jgi:uncharacterized DUF497 family protein
MLYQRAGLAFEWDNSKAAGNLAKHGVTFLEASTVFGDPSARIKFDGSHSEEEERYFILGYSDRQRLLAAAFTERGDNIRIITARAATPSERKSYEYARERQGRNRD